MSEPAGLLDTSVFIAKETGRPLGEMPRRVAVSVVTIGELQLGVLNATDAESRVRRAATLDLARTGDPIPISEAVVVTWARLVNEPESTGLSNSSIRSSPPPPSNTGCRSSPRTQITTNSHGPTLHRSWSAFDRSAPHATAGHDAQVELGLTNPHS